MNEQPCCLRRISRSLLDSRALAEIYPKEFAMSRSSIGQPSTVLDLCLSLSADRSEERRVINSILICCTAGQQIKIDTTVQLS